ncbi:hypothetical protein V1514DRAFT_328034 [Lipomyces japonicus]|uniref:uncharacterized protein n=1 Tax=Lipomyces japonicus TaxID=56871 RepID=UPI0034CD61BB
MVLHNSKWDKKATRAYKRKHGIKEKGLIDKQSNEDSNKLSSNGDEHLRSKDEKSDTEGSAANDADHDDENDEYDDENDELNVENGNAVPIRKKQLPSNSWRYLDQEATEEYVVKDDSEDDYLQGIQRPQDGGLSKYLDTTISQDVNDDDVRDIFESKIEINEPKTKSKDLLLPKKNKIVFFDANDDEYKQTDRRIEKLKYIETVRDKYKSTARKETDEELERLKRLPKSVASMVTKKKLDSKLSTNLDSDFDNFWSEIEIKDQNSNNIVPRPINEGRAGLGASSLQANNKTLLNTAVAGNIDSAVLHNNDEDDKFLDDLLNGKI